MTLSLVTAAYLVAGVLFILSLAGLSRHESARAGNVAGIVGMTIALLASSLLLTIGRGATLPFMTIYLTRRFQLEVDVIGYALSLALVVGVLFSMGFGILADRFDKKRYMVWSVLVFILGFSAIPLVNNALLVVIFFALINCAYSVFSTVLKA